MDSVMTSAPQTMTPEFRAEMHERFHAMQEFADMACEAALVLVDDIGVEGSQMIAGEAMKMMFDAVVCFTLMKLPDGTEIHAETARIDSESAQKMLSFPDAFKPEGFDDLVMSAAGVAF